MTINGSMHTHTSGSFDAPSAGDLYMLGQGNAANANYTTAFVLASDGSRYAFVVNDPVKLATFLANYPIANNFDPSTGGWLVGSNVYSLFTQAQDYFNPTRAQTGPVADEAFERAQAYILSAFDTGVSLLKADANGDFHEIHTTVSAGPVITFTKTDCP